MVASQSVSQYRHNKLTVPWGQEDQLTQTFSIEKKDRACTYVRAARGSSSVMSLKEVKNPPKKKVEYDNNNNNIMPLSEILNKKRRCSFRVTWLFLSPSLVLVLIAEGEEENSALK